MKNSTKILIGIFVVALVGAGFYFGGGDDLFKGSLQGTNKNITRAQLAKLVVDTLPPLTDSGFNELSPSCATDIAGIAEEKDICYLVNKNILLLFPDGSFKPDNSVTRAEAAKVFNKTFGQYLPLLVATTEYKPYSDVSKTDWFAGDVANLAAHDILDVKAGNKFYPGNYLTVGRANYWIKKIQEILLAPTK